MDRPTACVIATPPDPSGGVWVTVPALDGGERRHGPCIGWPRPHGGLTPTRGDLGLVVEDNTGQLWLIAWEASS